MLPLGPLTPMLVCPSGPMTILLPEPESLPKTRPRESSTICGPNCLPCLRVVPVNKLAPGGGMAPMKPSALIMPMGAPSGPMTTPSGITRPSGLPCASSAMPSGVTVEFGCSTSPGPGMTIAPFGVIMPRMWPSGFTTIPSARIWPSRRPSGDVTVPSGWIVVAGSSASPGRRPRTVPSPIRLPTIMPLGATTRSFHGSSLPMGLPSMSTMPSGATTVPAASTSPAKGARIEPSGNLMPRTMPEGETTMPPNSGRIVPRSRPSLSTTVPSGRSLDLVATIGPTGPMPKSPWGPGPPKPPGP
mmetsp:Transcript_47235/g.113309  ORF Transcript_47235/g.113309 Transcript_47235/m.113309 type:complete len:301 (-) Transcript_47235:748-1650(-)